MSEIRKVGVIGAGAMGAGIAAHVANAGVPVILLDIVPEGAANRDAIAEQAVERLLKSDPAAFMHKNNTRLITTGNTEDHLPLLADCDWIIESSPKSTPTRTSSIASAGGNFAVVLPKNPASTKNAIQRADISENMNQRRLEICE